jgi:hypothetical protein
MLTAAIRSGIPREKLWRFEIPASPGTSFRQLSDLTPSSPCVKLGMRRKGMEAEQSRRYKDAAIAILNVGCVDLGMHQPCVSTRTAFFPLDFHDYR